MSVRETVAVLGRERSLVGIMTAPEAPHLRQPAFVILNSGIIHRAGPNRLYVLLARRLAELGHPVLRLDLSGIGDSGPPSVGGTLLDTVHADVSDALDHLSAVLGAEHFVLAGLCSGADHGLVVGEADHRVVGVVAVDPTMFRTRRSYARWIFQAVVRPVTWLSLVRGRYDVWRGLRTRWAPEGEPPGPGESEPERRAHARAVVRGLTDRGVHLCCIFTGGHANYTYRKQFTDFFGEVDFKELLRLEHYPECSHTISAEDHKLALIETVTTWAATRWPAAEPAGPAGPAGKGA